MSEALVECDPVLLEPVEKLSIYTPIRHAEDQLGGLDAATARSWASKPAKAGTVGIASILPAARRAPGPHHRAALADARSGDVRGPVRPHGRAHRAASGRRGEEGGAKRGVT